MIIVFISFALIGVFIYWALCKTIPTDLNEDEEQMKFIKEWEKEHKRWKN